MSKSYKVFPRTFTMGEKKGQTVYSVRPYITNTASPLYSK